MAGFWKIEKDWVHEWGLTHFEAVVLADIKSCDKPCTLQERADRCGASKNGIRKALESIQKKVPHSVQNRTHSGTEESTHSVQNRTHSGTEEVHKVALPPYPPIIEEPKKNHEEHCDESRAREEEFRQLGMVKKVDELANELREEIRNGGSFITNTMQMYGLNPQQTEEYLGWFLNHLGMGGTTLKSRGDFRRHFTNWLGIQMREQLKRQQSNGTKYSSRNENPADLFTELG